MFFVAVGKDDSEDIKPVPRPILIEPAAPSTATAGPPTNVTVAAPAALSRVLQSQNSQDEASTDSDTVSNPGIE